MLRLTCLLFITTDIFIGLMTMLYIALFSSHYPHAPCQRKTALTGHRENLHTFRNVLATYFRSMI